ncbi:MAG: SH3 domain-containing protein [Kiritimatiellia bacterium]
MKVFIRWTAMVLMGVTLAAQAQTGALVVLNDRVNLRAKPRAEAEVAGQVNKGTNLEYRGESGEWFSVTPPESVGLWVSADFIKDGKAADKLNVRSGPGINYPAVGTLAKDEAVVERSAMGQWKEIAPPRSAVLWVHRDYVKRAEEAPALAPAAAPEAVTAAPPVVVADEPVKTSDFNPSAVEPLVQPVPLLFPVEPAKPAETAESNVPPDLGERGLVPLSGQGEVMEREGVLRRTSFLDFGRVSNYCLADRVRGRPMTVCYVRGNNAQLKEFEGRRLKIKGQGYWVKGGAKPVIVPKQITPLAGP